MSVLKCSDEPKAENKKQKILEKFSKPFRCINFPIACLIFFSFYWLILVPLVYHGLSKSCAKTFCVRHWNFLYWSATSLIFVILFGVAVCYYSCTEGIDDDDDDEEDATKPEETKEMEKERDRLLDPVKYNNLKDSENLYNLSIKNEKKPISQENFNTDNLESKIEKKTVTLPIRKSVTATEEVSVKTIEEIKVKEDSPVQNVSSKSKPDESMMEEIDKMFPRCSMRRKPEPKKRPDTLIIHSPKYPKEEQVRRFTVQEGPTTTSPLTPREVFFFDLLQSANRQNIDRTKNFLENERKHSSNNYTGNCEIKGFILKRRSEASSPEYFIANVPKRSSCTAEAFLFVDGGQPEETLTICYIDQNDDVFKN